MKNKMTIWIAAALVAIVLIAVMASRPTKDSDTLDVGAALALTGPQADFGLKVKRGLDMALDEINSSGSTRKVKLHYEDPLSTPKDGLGTKFIFGSGSYLANAIAPIADSKESVFFVVGTSLPGITEDRENVVRYSYTVDISAKVIAEYAKMHHKSVAVLFVEEEYGQIATRIFKENFEGDEREVVFEGGFRVKETEVRTLVSKALETNPDAVFVPGYGPGMVAVVRQIRSLDSDISLLGDVAFANSSIIEAIGDAAEQAVVPAMPLDGGIALSKRAKSFKAKVISSTNENPDMWTTGAYEALMLLHKAVENTDGSPTGVKRYLIDNAPHDSFSGPVVYTDSGESLIPMTLFTIKDGKLQELK
jgi:branched-chain amino acid transport system substrate-binding protein